MIQLLKRNKSYRNYFLCNNISKIGDFIDDLAFAHLVYLITNSTLFMAFVFIIKICFSFLTVIFAQFIDKINPKMYLCLCELFQAINLFILSFLYYKNMISPELLIVFTILQAALSTTSNPVKDSLLPLIVTDEDLQKARAVIMSLEKIIEILSYLVSAILIINVGFGLAFLLDGISFLVSMFLYSTINFNNITIEKETSIDKKSVGGGFQFILRNKLIFAIMIFTSLCNLILHPFDCMLPAFFSQNHYATYTYSIYMMLYAFGGAMASVIMIKYEVKNIKPILQFGYMVIAMSLLLICVPSMLSVFLSSILLGVSVTCVTSINMNTIQINTPKELMMQVMSLFRLICSFCGPFGILIVGIAGEFAPVKSLYILSGCIIVVISFICHFCIDKTDGYKLFLVDIGND